MIYKDRGVGEGYKAFPERIVDCCLADPPYNTELQLIVGWLAGQI